MQAYLNIIFIIMIILLTSVVIYYIYIYVNRLLIDKYNLLIEKHIKKTDKEVNKKRKCPDNCNKGLCNKNRYCNIYDLLDNRCCAFDFQCQNCEGKDNKVYQIPEDIYSYNSKLIKDTNKKIREVNKIREEENKKFGKLEN